MHGSEALFKWGTVCKQVKQSPTEFLQGWLNRWKARSALSTVYLIYIGTAH